MKGMFPQPGSSADTGFNPFSIKDEGEAEFPVRNDKDVKLGAADLFALFTADIIREEKTFTR